MPRKSTRTANNSGSIRQRPDGRWEARVSIGVDPATGKAIRRSFYGDTQKEVRQKMTAALSSLDTGTYQTPVKTTVGAWLDEWLETFCARKVKPLTYSSYKGIISNHIKPHIGGLQLQSVRGADVQRFYNTLHQKGAQAANPGAGAPMAAKTIKNVSAVLHKAFDMAIKQGLILANPCDAAELPKGERHEIKPLSDDEIPLFLQAISGEPMGNAFALCLLAGLREGECLGLSWANVDFKQGRITIKQQLQKSKEKGGAYYIAPFTKSNKPRVIQPPPLAFEYLREEKRRQNENRLKFGDAWRNEKGLVFTDELGDHRKISTFYKHFKRIAASIGRPDARPHDLRHTAATVAIASGADIKSVQDLLGHSTASFTLNVYAHTSDQMMQDTASRVQGYYDTLTIQK